MAKPVVIEDEVFIGSHVKMLTGSVISRGSVIANGLIVVENIQSNVVAARASEKALKLIEQ